MHRIFMQAVTVDIELDRVCKDAVTGFVRCYWFLVGVLKDTIKLNVIESKDRILGYGFGDGKEYILEEFIFVWFLKMAISVIA